MIMKNIAILSVLLFAALSAFPQKTVVTYSFDKPDIETDEQGYSVVHIDGCYLFGEEGEPLLPYYGANLLMPQGTEISEVRMLSIEFRDAITGITIAPAAKQFPISVGCPPGYKPSPDPAIYSMKTDYPEKRIGHENTGFLAGHSIGSFSISPLIYLPGNNEIRTVKSITIEIISTLTNSGAQKASLKSSELLRQRIEKLVENPEDLKNYDYPESKNEEADLLLITKNSLINAFDDFVSYKTSAGFIVETVSTEDIYSQYTGQDEQEKIRNCIIDYYENYGITFVILGGDSDPQNSSQDIIPHRGFYALDDEDIPSDMYYCCLDGNWNNDGDNRWGEDGEYDLYAEVGIGRICVDNATEIENFTNKIILYENSPVVDDIEKALMIGEELNNNPWTWGGDYKDEIAEGTSIHGFTTAGFPPNFTISKLYDRDGNWNKSDVFDQFNNTGVNLLNHLGHSSPTYNMKMYNSDINTSNFQNNGIDRGFVIGYSQGCYNGSFDNRDWNNQYGQDCFAEKITTIETAEVASVANSRYGWYAPGNTNSSSQFCDREFFDALFGEDIFQIGFVNSDSKEDLANHFASSGYMRWTVYELNLFGDPSMDIWTETPTDFAATYPASIPIGISSITFETGADQARVGLMQNGELIGRAVAGVNGTVVVETFEPVTSSDPIEVSITGHNKNRHNGSIVVITDQPYVLFDSYQVNDQTGNDNGEVDFGEDILLGIGVKNVGTQPASDVEVALSSEDAYISITDNSEYYGDFDPGQTIFLDDAFEFITCDSIPNGHTLAFTIEATGDSIWTSTFSVTACAPDLNLLGYGISDAQGNNNGRLDPGETADIIVPVKNAGMSDAPGSTATLNIQNPFITTTTNSCNLDILAAGEEKDAVFTIEVDAAAPVGSLADFSVEAASGYYSDTKSYIAKIGLIVEDWETGNFNQFGWSTGGHADWYITQDNPFEGAFCARSGDIGDQEISVLMLSYDVMFNDSISFYVKVSSEEGYDYLDFYIDGEKVGQWAGEVSWQKVTFPVEQGYRSFKWIYDKDTYVSSGDDCGWIDFIELPTPLSTTAYAGEDGSTCGTDPFLCQGMATNYTSLSWTTSGTGAFDDNTAPDAEYTPSQQDVDAGEVALTLTATGPEQTVSDEMTLTINQPVVLESPGTASVCSGETYQPDDLSAQFYSTINWTTGGDGSFDDPALLHPLYTPGSNDIAAGNVTLTIELTGMDPCGNMTADIDLMIHPVPEISLGPDTTVCTGHVFVLDAQNQGASFLWSTGETTQSIEVSSDIETVITYWVEVTNAENCMETGEITVSFEDCAGIADNHADQRISAYPNPVKDELNLTFHRSTGQLHIALFTQTGKLVMEKATEVNVGSFDLSLSFGHLPDGLYFLVCRGEDFTDSRKLIISK